jgi:hypothetical protein
MSKLMEPNQDMEIKECTCCRSHIHTKAIFCYKCNQWQSFFKRWFNPSAVVSIFAALAAWLAFYFQTFPVKSPELLAIQTVEQFEYMADNGCEKIKTNVCFDSFWELYSKSVKLRENVADLETRKGLHIRIENVLSKHGTKYAELPEWYKFPDDL